MNIRIGNLTITNFCSNNVEHIKFKKELADDDLVYQYVSVDIESDLHEVSDDGEIEIGNPYIVQDNKKLIAYIYMLGVNDLENAVEFRCAVHPEYRRLGYLGYHDSSRKGYGEQILEEFTNYLFENKNIDFIELHIRKDNEASIGCAEKSKYKCYGENNDEYYYIYRKYKK